MSANLHALLQSASPSANSSHPAVTIPATSSQPAIHLSYKQLSSHINEFSNALKKVGVKGGDVVSMSLPNSLEFVGAFLAVNGGCRGVAAPLNPAYSQSEVEFYLDDTKSSLLLVMASQTSEGLATIKAAKKCSVKVVSVHLKPSSSGVGIELKTVFDPSSSSKGASQTTAANKAAQPPDFKLIKEGEKAFGEEGEGEEPKTANGIANANQTDGAAVMEQDVALILHTSGTTGKPKGVPLTHLNIMTTMKNIGNTYEFTQKDRGLLVMPLFHVHGLVAGLLAPLLSGSSVVIPPRFSAGTFWKDFVGEKCNWYTAVPTMHSILLNSAKPNPLPNIRFIRSCSSSLSPTVFHNLEKTFNAPVLEAYAMTESAHAMVASPLPKNGPRYPGVVGMPQGVGVSIRSTDSGKEVKGEGRGEVCIRGKNVTLGYVNNPKANREGYWPPDEKELVGQKHQRWFRTGDEGYMTKEGYIVLTGRLKELINRGGEKISPIEVDSALLALDAVSEAVCFGVQDQKYGEVVWAAVVLKGGKKDDGKVEAALRKALEGKVAKFKIPDRVIVTEAIPKGATGKIQRKKVAEAFVKQEKEKAQGQRKSKL